MRSLCIVAALLLVQGISFASDKRVISAGGSVTELVFALNAGENIVASDLSSLYPQEAQDLTKVGYYRQLSAEGVLSLQPTTLVAAKGAGPEIVLQQLAGAGVEVKLFEQSTYTLEAWVRLVKDVGHFFDKSEEASKLIDKGMQQIAKAQKSRKYKHGSLNAVLLMGAGQRGLMVAGKNTMPDLLFQLSGLNNVASDIENYKTLSNESLIEKRVDIIIVPQHTLKASGGKEGVCNNPTIKLASHGHCNLLVMDSLLILGMGSRIDQAVQILTDYANTVDART